LKNIVAAILKLILAFLNYREKMKDFTHTFSAAALAFRRKLVEPSIT
jgi:hypothetical protein